MKNHRFLMAAGGLLYASAFFGQIKGKVVEINDSGDTTAVPGVVVLWYNTDVATSTDNQGNFMIRPTPATNKLLVKALGYEGKTVTVSDTGRFLLLILKSGVDLKEVEIVYQGSGTEISYLNPIKMELLTERSLMKAACCNLSESFETNPSIDVNFTDAVSGTKQIQMLGLSGQYAQITKENMPYLRGLANNYGLTFIPGTWIQSIQLSKGAGSVLNGYESFTGQINTELQSPDLADRLNLNSYVNENGRNEYNLNLKQKLSEKLAVGLLSHASYNPLAEDKNHDGFADIPTGKQYNLINKYSIQTKKGFEAQLGGGYLMDDRNGGQFRQLLPALSDSMPLYKIGINNEKWELYSKTGFVFKNRPGASTGLQLSYLNHEQNNFYGSNKYHGLQKTFYANWIYQGIIGSTNNTFKTGTSFMNDNVNETFNQFKFNRDENVGGAFLEFAHSYKERFNIVAGLRADLHNYYGLFFTPRLHLRYAFTPSSVVRLSGGKALRTANIFSDNSYLMASSRNWTVENSDAAMPYGLKPETGWNYGLNFTQKFKINFREAYFTIDVYRTDFSSQVVADIDNNPQAVLIYNIKGPSYSNTAQFEFNMEPRKRLFVKLAYRYVDNKMSFKEGLLQKTMVSRDRAFINLSYETKNNHWQFDFTTQYHGPKRLPHTGTNPQEYQRANYSPDYFIVLGQVSYLTRIFKTDFNVYLGVENLLDYKQNDPIVSPDLPYGRYFNASMVWGPIYGRMLYAGLRWKIK